MADSRDLVHAECRMNPSACVPAPRLLRNVYDVFRLRKIQKYYGFAELFIPSNMLRDNEFSRTRSSGRDLIFGGVSFDLRNMRNKLFSFG